MENQVEIKRAEFVKGLRELATFLEEHPSLSLPEEVNCGVFHFGQAENASLVQSIAQQLGTFKKQSDETFFKLVKGFGPHKLRFVFYREKVCVSRVVGKKTIKVYPADVEMVEKEVDALEWDCPVLLGSGSEDD